MMWKNLWKAGKTLQEIELRAVDIVVEIVYNFLLFLLYK